MKGSRKLMTSLLCLGLALCCGAALAETAAEETEQGLEELMPLMEMSEVDETEGMSLEEMTNAYAEAAMSEYYDYRTGFSMQYPSIFQFIEGGNGNTAAPADGRATLAIDNMNQGGLNEQTLTEALKLEMPDAAAQKNEQNGCLRYDRTMEDGRSLQTDLYLLTEKSLHHVTVRYPAEEKESFEAYIDYMINTMETAGTDLG